jgi:hypothetical protein
LSTWLRDYLYIPLGGNRGGELMRLRNVFITFLLGGIWHGAGWTFVIWGALHGAYNVSNHLLRKVIPPQSTPDAFWIARIKQACVMVLVIIAWVFFRAKTVSGAMSVVKSMFFFVPKNAARLESADFSMFFWLAVATLVAMLAPNSQQMTNYTPKVREQLRLPQLAFTASLRRGAVALSASPAVAILCGFLFAGALACIWRPVIFIYFNF